jgi:signal transduction histidine kinase
VSECYRCVVSLRTKLLVLFGLLAVAPLTALGVFDYFRSEHSVRRLLATQTGAVAERIARGTNERLALVRGNLELFANNQDTRRLISTGQDREQAERFLNEALTAARMPGVSLVFRDTVGREVLEIGGSSLDPSRAASPIDALVRPPPSHSIAVRIVDDAGRSIGAMTATLRIDQLFPRPVLEEHVGLNGHSIAVDRTAGVILLDPSPASAADRGLAALSAAHRGDSTRETVNYLEHDSAWVGAIAPVGEDGLAVLSSASLSEFSAPIAALRGANLFLALIVAVAVAISFFVLARRLARPIESLTLAADEIGRGNFKPELPSVERHDEVGRLTTAFGRMSAHVRETMQQLESSRHMAAVGAFASQISHEIRNPLTSIKLNLQSIQRGSTARNASPAEQRALEICLSEIQRLDGVVRGALQLAQTSRRMPTSLSVHAALDGALSLMGEQLDAHGIAIDRQLLAEDDVVIGDANELRGVLLNLLVNAVDALPNGGRVRVTTAQRTGAQPAIRIAVEDSGRGVPADLHETIFEPFVTTKRHGSGLGLALAARDVEKHLGRLSLRGDPSDLGGATFVVELPLARSERRS